MRITRFLLSLALAICLGQASTAFASLITSAGSLSGPTTIVNFSQFSSGFTFGGLPTQVGGLVGENIVWNSNNSSAVIGNGIYGLVGNGYWDTGRNGYVGINSSNPSSSMTFVFNTGPVSGVGGFVNYAPVSYGVFFIEAIGAGNVVLESYNVTALAPISTPNQVNAGAFRGISRASNDIYGFRLSGAFDVLDDLQFSREVVVPVPSSMILACIGVAILIVSHRLRSKNVVVV